MFYFDHFGSKCGQESARTGAGNDPAQIYDSETIESKRLPPLTNASSVVAQTSS
jgi:hypothetical protein